MDKNKCIKVLDKLRKDSKKRNFKQSVELIINLQDMDFKNPQHKINLFINLNKTIGKKRTVCAFVDMDLVSKAKKVFDKVIDVSEFTKYSENIRVAKKLAGKYDFFVSQANIMAKVASNFGRILGPRNKMPNPKVGCVINPKTDFDALYNKLQHTIAIRVERNPVVHLMVGKEDMKDDDIVDNIIIAYNTIVHSLPKEKNNMKNVLLKFTMSKPIKLM